MIKEIRGNSIRLTDGELKVRENDNREYLMRLKNEYLLRNFQLEAGRYAGRGKDAQSFGGWEDPTCQLRGHFLGHWLSGAALRYEETGDAELKAKAEAILRELAACQKDNGGRWAGPIPEKYFTWLGTGKPVWAPQYTVHKLMMGLVDAYLLMGCETALDIAQGMADWFYDWSGRYTREQFDDILDTETGGMLEIWAELYAITGKPMYRQLMDRYYRSRLFDPLLEGRDMLTNMHANTTIPEVLGCARAWEVTGEQRWMDIVKAYWRCAVTERGSFVTGGQTQGEIWTPKMKLKARLGDKNQEHCTVYNMIRLAEFLFRHTGDPAYMHYIEYNERNGIMAQTYWHGDAEEGKPGFGLLTYFLPMKAGSKKDWAGETDSFFCCHGTMVQANAAWNRRACYADGDRLYVTAYRGFRARAELQSGSITLSLHKDTMNGTEMTCSENSMPQRLTGIASVYDNRPGFDKYVLRVEAGKDTPFTLLLRVPDWITGSARFFVNGEELPASADTARFYEITRVWHSGDTVYVILPIGVTAVPLPDDESTVAFRFGPDALAAITKQERILFTESDDPAKELSPDTERQWGEWRTFLRTENQDPGLSFMPLNRVGYLPYQLYFRIKRKDKNT